MFTMQDSLLNMQRTQVNHVMRVDHYQATTDGFTVMQLSNNFVYFQIVSSLVLSLHHHCAINCLQGAPPSDRLFPSFYSLQCL